MRIVKLSDLSDDEKKKVLAEQQARIEENNRARQQEQQEANQRFNEVVSREGSYDTSKHTYRPADLKRNSTTDYWNTFKKSNNMTLWDTVKETANAIGKIAENTWIGAKNGLENFSQAIDMAMYDTQKNRFNFGYNDKDFLKKNPDIAKKIQQTDPQKYKEIMNNEPTPVSKESSFPDKLEASTNPANIQQNKEEAIKKHQNKKNEYAEQIQKNLDNIENPILKKTAELASNVGNILPGFIPGIGAVYTAGSAKGAYYDDAMQRGMNEEQANTYSGIMSMFEGLTEQLTIGNIKKGGQTIKKLVGGTAKEVAKEGTEELGKTSIKSALKHYGISMAENALQEGIMEPLQEITASVTGGKDKANWENMGQRMLQSGIDGGLTAGIMDGANAGINSCIGIVQKIRNGQTPTLQETQIAVKEASESGKVDFENSIIESTQQQFNKYKQNMTQNTGPNQIATNLQNNLPQNTPNTPAEQQVQRTAQQIEKVAQNGNMRQTNTNIQNQQQIDRTETINNLKIRTEKELTGSEKTDVLDFLNNTHNIDESSINSITEVINMARNNTLNTNETYKTGRQQKYVKYMNKTNEYDSSALQQAKEIIPGNKQGRRTKEQWLQVAEQIGNNIAGKSASEIEEIAYRTWQEERPASKESLNRQGNKYVQFTSDDWINTIYDTVKKIDSENLNLQTKGIVANNQNLVYNNGESRIDENGRKQNDNERSNGEIWNGNVEESTETNRKYSWEEYDRWEQSIKPIEAERLAKSEKKSIENAKTDYDKIVQLYDENENDNTYSGGASKNIPGQINISRQQSQYFGLDYMIAHENVESDIMHIEEANDILESVKEAIIRDSNFSEQKKQFWKEQTGNMPTDELIAKDIICDRFAERKGQKATKYINVLTKTTRNTIDMALDNYYKQVYGKELANFNYNTENSNKSSFSVQESSNSTQQLRLPTKENAERVNKSNTKRIPLGNKVQADRNLKDFKEDVGIKNDIITQKTIPMSEKKQSERIAKILSESPEKGKESDRKWAIFKAGVLDKGIVFEELSHKTKNRELQGKWDYTLSATARGQNAIGNARYEFDSKTKSQKQICKSLEDIRTEVGEDVGEFSNYMYHQLNVDRMTLEERFNGDTGINYERKAPIMNKPVFGDSITAEISKAEVTRIEKAHPEFKDYAQDVYDFLNANKSELVNNGVISQSSSDRMAEMYPHYVPTGRVNTKGNAVNVPLDTGRTGVNSPIKSAKGGSSDILPLFDTIAQRTLQTYRASARNSFGVELKNTLNTVVNTEQADVDNVIDTMGQTIEEQGLLKEGKNGNNPTFTVFENGEKVTYEITKDMYDALKPVSESSILGKTYLPLNKVSNFRRGVLTEYNPLFMITNAVKDVQDVLINSQHSAKTYSKFPEAYAQITKKGYWYQEYVQNGGEQNSYFNANDNIFESDVKKSKLRGALNVPLNTISNINNVIELAPRLSEYIASRETGRSIETSMLDASRVTTNFKAGGDITKALNRNGATFLNASIQGMMQQVRNITEANTKGLKGYAVLATKYAIAGLPALILNNLVWGDDDDYDELQDYVKDNYYCIAKFGDGRFIRIPKGRMLSTIQSIVTNASEYITKDKKFNIDNFASDFWEDLQSIMDNVAPNNPLDNNVISPIIQAITNKSWYGEDIVPSRLQDKPAAEQYDETTDSLSKWLGEKLNISPYKINYLLDQYGGGISDVALPMMTKQAENNPMEDKFTTDSVMKSKYPGNFFDTIDKLKVNANGSKATDEDKIKYKYMSSLQGDLSELYKKKREIQNSDISDKDKKAQLKEVQKEINQIARECLSSLDKLETTENTAKIGNRQYYKATNLKSGEKEWKELSEEDEEKTKGISLKTYADYKEKIAQTTINQRKNGTISDDGQLKDNDKIQILLSSNYSESEKSSLYKSDINSKDDLYNNLLSKDSIDINQYLNYKLQEFTSDKEDNGTLSGKSISGSKKKKVYDFVNNMNITPIQRVMLIGSQYKLDRRNQTQLYNYINNLDGSVEEKTEIFKKYNNNFIIYNNGTLSLK